jgi:predicted amidohydrolase YtcJ
MTTRTLLRDVEVAGRAVDVLLESGRITAVGPDLRPAGFGEVAVVDGGGGALLPGLHDHHVHLLATAAARASVPVGPRDVRDRAGLVAALRSADATLPPGRWIRAIGYHERVAGDLDRATLDALVPGRPVRVQHRSGARWTLSSAALVAIGVDARDGTPRPGPHHPGLELDASGRATGRLHRADAWLRARLPDDGPPDLAALGTELARFGVTGVTDTTPCADLAEHRPVAAAVRAGELPQRVVVTGGVALAGAPAPDGLALGPVKVVIDDGDDYPALADLVAAVRTAHEHHRPVAVHCVTRAALVLALATWKEAGAAPGDRIEHGAVVPPEVVPDIAAVGLTVVTQPALVAERGDEYRLEVDPEDLPHLYPCATLQAAGVEVAGSSDAPYTDPDPWAAMRAAVRRETAGGVVLGAAEAISPEAAVALYLGWAERPGGRSRRVAAGEPADLCLLAVPWGVARARLDARDVAWTCVAGRPIG